MRVSLCGALLVCLLCVGGGDSSSPLQGADELARGLTNFQFGANTPSGAAALKQLLTDLDNDATQLSSSLTAQLAMLPSTGQHGLSFGNVITTCQTYARYGRTSLLVDASSSASDIAKAKHEASPIVDANTSGANHILRLLHEMITGTSTTFGNKSIFSAFAEILSRESGDYVEKIVEFVAFVMKIQQSCYQAWSQANALLPAKAHYKPEMLYNQRKCDQAQSIKDVLAKTYPYYWASTSAANSIKAKNVLRSGSRKACSFAYNGKMYAGTVGSDGQCRISYNYQNLLCLFGSCSDESSSMKVLYNRCQPKSFGYTSKAEGEKKVQSIVTMTGARRVCSANKNLGQTAGSIYARNYGTVVNDMCVINHLVKVAGSNPGWFDDNRSAGVAAFDYITLDCNVLALYENKYATLTQNTCQLV